MTKNVITLLLIILSCCLSQAKVVEVETLDLMNEQYVYLLAPSIERAESYLESKQLPIRRKDIFGDGLYTLPLQDLTNTNLFANENSALVRFKVKTDASVIDISSGDGQQEFSSYVYSLSPGNKKKAAKILSSPKSHLDTFANARRIDIVKTQQKGLISTESALIIKNLNALSEPVLINKEAALKAVYKSSIFSGLRRLAASKEPTILGSAHKLQLHDYERVYEELPISPAEDFKVYTSVKDSLLPFVKDKSIKNRIFIGMGTLSSLFTSFLDNLDHRTYISPTPDLDISSLFLKRFENFLENELSKLNENPIDIVLMVNLKDWNESIILKNAIERGLKRASKEGEVHFIDISQSLPGSLFSKEFLALIEKYNSQQDDQNYQLLRNRLWLNQKIDPDLNKFLESKICINILAEESSEL